MPSQPANNRLTVTNQWTFQVGAVEKRFDVVFVVNGLPLVIGEAKTPTRSAVTWFDGAFQINEIYEKQVPAMFVPNVFSFATEGRLFRYGSIRMPIDMWGPWRDDDNQDEGQLQPRAGRRSRACCGRRWCSTSCSTSPLFATDKKHRRIKIICRYQQYETTNKIVDRVVKGYPKKGLIWHFQGSGKSLLMVFAAQKLRLHPQARQPHGDHRGGPHRPRHPDHRHLQRRRRAQHGRRGHAARSCRTLLGQDVRKVLITTIHKFGEAGGKLNERSNIIVMVDEAHRTQEGDLGRKMREALPNAFLFGLTGTPINRADRNTFWAFGADEDEQGLHEPLLVPGFHPRQGHAAAALRGAGGAAEDRPRRHRRGLQRRSPASSQRAGPRRPRQARRQDGRAGEEPGAHPRRGAAHRDALPDQGGAQRLQGAGGGLRPRVLRALQAGDGRADRPGGERHRHAHGARATRRSGSSTPATRTPKKSCSTASATRPTRCKFVIVTSKLLTGFDAPILQAMYLDKPMKDHNLLQAICRTNRTFGQEKTHGLIVDYIGIFDDVAQALDFDEKAVQQVVSQHRRAAQGPAGAGAEVPGVLPRRGPHASAATRA